MEQLKYVNILPSIVATKIKKDKYSTWFTDRDQWKNK